MLPTYNPQYVEENFSFSNRAYDFREKQFSRSSENKKNLIQRNSKRNRPRDIYIKFNAKLNKIPKEKSLGNDKSQFELPVTNKSHNIEQIYSKIGSIKYLTINEMKNDLPSVKRVENHDDEKFHNLIINKSETPITLIIPNTNENKNESPLELNKTIPESNVASRRNSQIQISKLFKQTLNKISKKNRKNLTKSENLTDIIYSVVKEPIYKNVKESSMESLFSYVICASLKQNNQKTYSPYIDWKFPDQVSEFNEKMVDFCFPDPTSDQKYKKKNYIRVYGTRTEIFQLIFTNEDATRTFGFCLKLYSKSTVPVVYCIVSPVDASEMYNIVLLEAERLHYQSPDDCKAFLEASYSKPLPNRGESVDVSFGYKNIAVLRLKRNYDRRLVHANLNAILKYPASLVIKIFSSILAEKKIIFLSNKISLLSDTIQAFKVLLYPFDWPHIFVPVLPNYLIDLCQSPSLFIIGILKKMKKDLMKMDHTDVFIVDLDKKKVLKEDGSEGSILPPLIIDWIKPDLEYLSCFSKDYSSSEKNYIICNLFLKVFVKTIGHYKNHLIFNEKKVVKRFDKRFDYEGFINEIQCDQTKEFLKWFTQTCIFDIFIQQKTTPNLDFGLIFDESISGSKTVCAARK